MAISRQGKMELAQKHIFCFGLAKFSWAGLNQSRKIFLQPDLRLDLGLGVFADLWLIGIARVPSVPKTFAFSMCMYTGIHQSTNFIWHSLQQDNEYEDQKQKLLSSSLTKVLASILDGQKTTCNAHWRRMAIWASPSLLFSSTFVLRYNCSTFLLNISSSDM